MTDNSGALDSPEDLDKMLQSVDGVDVGQKRFQMYELLRKMIEKEYKIADKDLPELGSRITDLKEINGYFYKLVQEFLTSSSTLEKERKLEKIAEHLKSRM